MYIDIFVYLADVKDSRSLEGSAARGEAKPERCLYIYISIWNIDRYRYRYLADVEDGWPLEGPAARGKP